MVGTLEPVDGMVKRHNHLRIGQYHQHLTELLPMDMSPLDYMVRALREFVMRKGAVWYQGQTCAIGSGCSCKQVAYMLVAWVAAAGAHMQPSYSSATWQRCTGQQLMLSWLRQTVFKFATRHKLLSLWCPSIPGAIGALI
jgi:hypothetical protein